MFVDWSFWKLLDFIAFICFMIIPWPMLIVAYFYVNNPKHKNRLVELGYGLNNKWIRGRRIGFVDSSMLFMQMPGIAYIFKIGHRFGRTNPAQMLICPNLHRDQNYLKIWQEFRFYCVWTTSAFLICFFGAFCLFIGMGIDKGWF